MRDGGGIKPQTVRNGLAHLGSVLLVAKPAWGDEVDPHAMGDARKVLRQLGMISKSSERNRRSTQAALVFAGDDDPTQSGNPGRTKAEAAAAALDAVAAFPALPAGAMEQAA